MKTEKAKKHQRITTATAANRILFHSYGKNAPKSFRLVQGIGACEYLFVGFDDNILNEFKFHAPESSSMCSLQLKFSKGRSEANHL